MKRALPVAPLVPEKKVPRLLKKAFQWMQVNSIILVNAGSLVGTTAVTSLLGFVYWALAAREYPPSAVGVAAAVVSGTSLLGSAAALGLGTLVISELPRHQGREPALIATVMVPPVLVGS